MLSKIRWQVPFRIFGIRGYFTIMLVAPMFRVTFITRPIKFGNKK